MSQPLGASMYGAVDLSGLSNRTNGRDGSAAPTGAASANPTASSGASVPGPLVTDITADSLQGALEMSQRVPVVVLFHTSRSEPTAALDRQLQALATQQNGRFQLGRVDVDAAPEVAQAFRITGAPAVVALLQGQPIPLFEGAPAKAELTTVIDRLLEAAARYGITGVLDGDAAPPQPQLPPHHKEAAEALSVGDLDTAHAEYTAAVKANPGDAAAQTGVAQVELLQRVRVLNPEQTLRAAESDRSLNAQLAAADVEVAYGRPDEAFARLLAVIRRSSGEERDSVRKRLLALFEIVGTHEPVVAQARRELSAALF
ncbi:MULTISPECIES: tetratricopeptide repeat protein [unclassified Actinobaculum]|uniref:tetratricopeptide repeat protein n=1 Tax=unclassified Actinobaculum TaxID=2609299 RepID=UPI0013DE3EE7|nr:MULTISPECIES: tetratricopeptide repeat protein [unclassified Actinobaculum]